MKSNLRSHLQIKKGLMFFLVLLQIFPVSVFASAGNKNSTKGTVAFVPFSGASTAAQEINKEFSIALRNKLKSQFNILDVGSTEQILKTSLPKKIDGSEFAISPEDEKIISLIHDGRDAYNLNHDTSLALKKLDECIGDIKNKAELSQKSSDLLLSTLTNKAWILAHEGKTEEASQILKSIYSVSPNAELSLRSFPSSFKNFARKQKMPVLDSSLDVRSNPQSVQVLINAIYVGDSPLKIDLPSGSYDVVLSSAGRKAFRKQVVLGESQQQTITAKLGWGQNPQKTSGQVASASLNRAAYFSKISAATGAEKTVLFEFIPSGNGFIPQLVVYDSKHNQVLRPIRYKKTVNIRAAANDIVTYFADKLNPYLSNDAASLYKKDFDAPILDQDLADRPKQPLYKRPAFLAAIGAAIIGGTVLGIVLANGLNHAAAGSGSGGIGITLPGM